MGWKINDITDPELRLRLRAAAEAQALAGRSSDSVPQRPAGPTLERSAPAEAPSAGRARLRITRRAIRLLDVDNFAGGAKFLIDSLRYEGLIVDDSPDSIVLEFAQEKVSSKKEEGTEIIVC